MTQRNCLADKIAAFSKCMGTMSALFGQYSNVPEFGLTPVPRRGMYYNARSDEPINFMSFYPSGRFESALHNVAHELGYAFNGGHGSIRTNSMPDKYLSQRKKILAP